MPYAVVSKLQQAIAIGSVVIRGNAVDRSPGKSHPEYRIYGWALTTDVPDDVWETWIKASARSHAVVNGMIFGSKDLMEARRYAFQNGRGAGFGAGAPRGTVAGL